LWISKTSVDGVSRGLSECVSLYLRGDSGFICPDLFELLESNGTSYAIRLKVNGTLTKLAESLEKELDEITADNKVGYAVVYGEFRYAAEAGVRLDELL